MEMSTTVRKATFRKKVKLLSNQTDSSQEETEHLRDLWCHIIQKEVQQKRHQVKLNALINEYEENGDSENVGLVKAENALPVYRKEFRKVLDIVYNLEYAMDACCEERFYLL